MSIKIDFIEPMVPQILLLGHTASRVKTETKSIVALLQSSHHLVSYCELVQNIL